MIGLWDITHNISRQIETTTASVEEFLFEPVIRLGVTGLSRAGKTVFITSLVANLLNRGRMPQLRAAAEGRIQSAFLQPQPNDAIARFDYEGHMAALSGPTPHWPENTRAISQLRLSLKLAPQGLLSGMTGPRTVHIDIIDYPGEWLLDLPLLSLNYRDWSEAAIALARTPARLPHAKNWLASLETCDANQMLDESIAQTQARLFTAYQAAARAAGLSAVAPGRFLMPGDLEGSPALTFAPLPSPDKPGSKSLHRAFERRFASYKRIIVKPFFRDHFAGIDRQIVLVDTLSAINAGPQALDDLRHAMADILTTFRPGRNSWLSSVLGTRVERILFASTKADHLHHTQHDKLTAITEALLSDARRAADFKGAETLGLSIAAIRATIEETVSHDGAQLDCVRGILRETGTDAAMFAGELPSDPAHLLAPARKGQQKWLEADFDLMQFNPPHLTLAPGDGPPHIRLDRAAEFLIGDRLK